jgi:hypothetical protein
MVEPEAADLAGAVLDRDYQILIAFELRDKIDRRVFPLPSGNYMISFIALAAS